MTVWAEVAAASLVPGARMLTGGMGAPLIKTVERVDAFGSDLLVVHMRDGVQTTVGRQESVWARFPEGGF